MFVSLPLSSTGATYALHPPTCPPELLRPESARSIHAFAFPELMPLPARPTAGGQPSIPAPLATTPLASRSEHVFVMTASSGKRGYGYCRRISTPPDRASSSRPYLSYNRDLQRRTSNRDGEGQDLNQRCLLVLSDKPNAERFFMPLLRTIDAVIRKAEQDANELPPATPPDQRDERLRELVVSRVGKHVFVPVLPPAMIAYACAPMPYIVGVLEAHRGLLAGQPLGDVVYVDLDRGTLQLSESVTDLNFVPDLLQASAAAQADGDEPPPAGNNFSADGDVVPNVGELLHAELAGELKADRKLRDGGEAQGVMGAASAVGKTAKGLMKFLGKNIKASK
ncbi:hypothetical protein TeGR_g4632 [Tetraparma gracilis]|uniref:UDENN domain-containing protein n=1 Tax=Tetraparma gracilis TaxID=2962635 RepID=A0ABQ6NCC3_9STRA|nr:hypothetical protein TeGR_g4632 [Tetraparma gracilis]